MPFPQRHPAKFTTSGVLGAVRLVLTDHCKHLEYDKDKEKIINVVKNFSLASTEGPADPTNVVLGAPTIGREVDPLVTLKPFGTLGDKTINEVAVFLRDLKWDVLLGLQNTNHVKCSSNCF